jgi:hypothetical protein
VDEVILALAFAAPLILALIIRIGEHREELRRWNELSGDDKEWYAYLAHHIPGYGRDYESRAEFERRAR